MPDGFDFKYYMQAGVIRGQVNLFVADPDGDESVKIPKNLFTIFSATWLNEPG